MSALYCLFLLPNKTMHESVNHDDSFFPGRVDCDFELLAAKSFSFEL